MLPKTKVEEYKANSLREHLIIYTKKMPTKDALIRGIGGNYRG